jgi:alanine racemase
MTREFPTWVEIDLDVLRQNVNAIRSTLDRQKILLVVKADAYGHGAVEVAREALAAGVEMLGVATLHEGIELRRAGIAAPVLVLSPCLASETPEIVEHGLRCTVSHLGFLAALGRAARAAQTVAPVHLEVDTGMGRSGVAPEEAEPLAQAIAGEPGLRLEGLFTHFPDADAPDLCFSHQQLARFLDLRAAIERLGITVSLVHAANSAGLARIPGARLDLVRPGLLAYGLRPPGAPASLRVHAVMSFRSRLLQVRELPAGHPVSYGRTFVTPRPMRVGVVAVGYGHGLGRNLSNRGQMLVRGKRVPVVGRVTMDMTMVDLEATPEAAVEDEVVIFGEQAGASLALEEVAALSGTIPYEIMCSIGKRVPRVFRRGAATVKVTTLIGERRRGASGRRVEYSFSAPAAPRAPHSMRTGAVAG